jgi:translocation and assembly module TamB
MELPLTGSIHATYHGRSDRLDVAGLNLAARTTRLNATGAIGPSSQMRVSLNTTDLSELTPVMRALGSSEGPLPAILHGQASFNGTVSGTLKSPNLTGHLQATDFDTLMQPLKVRFGAPAANSFSPAVPHRLHWDSLVADVGYSPTSAYAKNVVLKRGKARVTGSETASLIDGTLEPESPLEIRMALRDTELADVQAVFGSDYPVTGTLTAQLTLTGTKENLDATGHAQLLGGSIYDEPYRSFSADLQLQGSDAEFRNILFQQNGGRISGESKYNFTTDAFAFDVTGRNFDLAHISRLRNGKVSLGGRAEFSASGSGTTAQPILNGKVAVTGLTFNGESAGDLVVTAATRGSNLHLEGQSHTQLASANLAGDIGMHGDLPAELHFDLIKLDFDPLLRAYLPGQITGHSQLSGKFVLRGPLRHPHDITVSADVDQFFVDIQNVKLQNEGPLRFSLSKEVASIEQLHIVGTDTDITGTGKVELTGSKRVDLHGNGHVNMALLQNLNSDVASSGQMTFTVNATGNLNAPNFAGNVQIAKGAIAFVDLPNGLSDIEGTLSFDRNRLRVQKLTAKTGGGALVLGGYITYANGIFFDLTATGRDIRIRYPEGVSSQATADVRLVGTAQNSILSGDVTITKFGLTPQFDLAAYVQRSKQPPSPPSPNSLVDNVRLDVHIVSTPDLRVETSLARLAGDVDIHLRGTAARPSVIGRVSIAEGDITFNSTTYHLERGDIVFANPVRIEPVVNVEASARVRDYDITLGFHGTPDKLNVTYRSEPPLPSADIIALLAFGRTRQESEIQAEQGSQAASAQSFAQTASNAILGEALNSAVSSRVQKLFGISRIKIDPNLGGTEDNPNARLTIEQQISKNVTVTYLTNLGQYAEEVLQVEYSINKNVSVVAVRDYTGVLAIDFRIRQRKR